MLGRDEADAQLLATLLALAALQGRRARSSTSPGSRTSSTRRTRCCSPRAPVCASRRWSSRAAPAPTPRSARCARSTATRLDTLDAGDDRRRLLDELWEQVARLHEARVAHGALNATHVVRHARRARHHGVRGGRHRGDRLPAFGRRRRAPRVDEPASSATTARSPPPCAGSAPTRWSSALPLLQPGALQPRDAAEAPEGPQGARQAPRPSCAAAAAQAASTEEPPLQQLYRVNTTSLLMAVGTLIAVFALLSQVGDPEEFYETIKDADWFLARRRAPSSRSSPTSPPRSRSWARCRSRCRSCAPPSSSCRCRSRTSRCRPSAAWPRRSGSSRSRASTSRRRSRRAGCSPTSATSSQSIVLLFIAVCAVARHVAPARSPPSGIVEVVLLVDRRRRDRRGPHLRHPEAAQAGAAAAR